MIGKLTKPAGCLVKFANQVKRRWNTNAVLLGSIVITSIILAHRLRKHLL